MLFLIEEKAEYKLQQEAETKKVDKAELNKM
ncbi:hypothetical protein RCA_04095 [Rickettsia canadensis str. CA410]|uniref:Uncharacterized protein n=1 Tax=Rickettsia canadensis str. CA410 TaxID=1105107 RepID=A0ABN4ADL3_RICCA|nr:hypothetical protein RCA_04095 [Rickettsia canadensis str. CA410]